MKLVLTRRVVALTLVVICIAPVVWAQNSMWIEDGLPICTLGPDQFAPGIASDGVGGAYIAWIEYPHRL